MAAPLGNDFNKKWNTPEARKKACKAVIEHLEAGYNWDTFPGADIKTIKRYMEEFPDDFPSDQIGEAERTGFLEWEKIGKAGTVGKIQNFNASSWKFIVGNKMGWREKQSVDTTLSGPNGGSLEFTLNFNTPSHAAELPET